MKDLFTQQFKDVQEMTEKASKYVPKVTVNKNGYEIRAQILEMAQNQLWNDYTAKWGQFETTVSKDGEEVVTTVTLPQVPGVDQVLEAAEKFYSFVNKK